MSRPYKFFAVDAKGPTIVGDRDALVELRSAINEALAHGRATFEVSTDGPTDETVIIQRVGA